MLVCQLKAKSAAFSDAAPVRAAAFASDGRFDPLQTLTPKRVFDAVVLPIGDDRAVALWTARHGVGAALAGADGRFRATATPCRPSACHISTRDVRVAGHYTRPR